MADITIDDHGSILIFRGTSPEGKRWMAEHLPEDAQRWGRGIVVEAFISEATKALSEA